jgi:gamma-D-glutamyl-L-lysine dipeptidyl-peptidase
MSYAVCCVPVAALRSNPDHRSEMVSQLVFGECACITFIEKLWCKIVAKTDEYSGWCPLSQLQEVSEKLYNSPVSHLTAGWVNEINYQGNAMMVPFGSSLTGIINGKANWQNKDWAYAGEWWNLNEASATGKRIKKLAYTFLNTPYIWGGRTVFGTDCSGFTQMVFKFLNINLHRDSNMQAAQGELVGFIQQAVCGDLAFFDNEDGKITHVGIMLNQGEIIHAAGKVRVDKIDNQGIIHSDTGERLQKLRLIRRYF